MAGRRPAPGPISEPSKCHAAGNGAASGPQRGDSPPAALQRHPLPVTAWWGPSRGGGAPLRSHRGLLVVAEEDLGSRGGLRASQAMLGVSRRHSGGPPCPPPAQGWCQAVLSRLWKRGVRETQASSKPCRGGVVAHRVSTPPPSPHRASAGRAFKHKEGPDPTGFAWLILAGGGQSQGRTSRHRQLCPLLGTPFLPGPRRDNLIPMPGPPSATASLAQAALPPGPLSPPAAWPSLLLPPSPRAPVLSPAPSFPHLSRFCRGKLPPQPPPHPFPAMVADSSGGAGGRRGPQDTHAAWGTKQGSAPRSR